MDNKLKVLKGSILIAQNDMEYAKGDKKYIIKAGEKVVVGFDGLLHSLKENVAFTVDSSLEIDGYSANGLSEYIAAFIDHAFDLDKILKRTTFDRDDFKEAIENALLILGMKKEEIEDETHDRNE